MKKLISMSLILFLSSCTMFKKDGIEMMIKNNSNQLITEIEFTTTEKLEIIRIDKIEPNESESRFLSMRKNRSDGEYILTFNRKNKKKEIRKCGYYTNGGSLDHWVDFIIENDTTIVRFDAPIY